MNAIDSVPDQLESVKFKFDVCQRVAGSAVFEMQNSKAVCSIKGPFPRTGFTKEQSHPEMLKINIQIPTYSNTDTDVAQLHYFVKHTFESIIVADKYDSMFLEIDVIVLEGDDYLRSVVLNVVSLALVHANVSMRDLVFSATEKVNFEREGQMEKCAITLAFTSANLLVLQYWVDGKIPVHELTKTDIIVRTIRKAEPLVERLRLAVRSKVFVEQ
ncbi:hypothetical protein PCE1_001357 [Barthelona sp. PCE]